MKNFKIPLMHDNIDKSDISELIKFLSQDEIPKLTNGSKVFEFEKKWSEWLGVKYSLMLNSGASANELTLLAINYLYGGGEIIVPPLTWISDISSIIFSEMKPVFCDINMKNLSFDLEKLIKLITPQTKAIFLTHVLGLNGLTEEILELCKQRNILLIEDVCESHGTTFKEQKVGSYGFASNFSFYFAHHMSTIEGGMISTNDYKLYQICRALRSHGMIREMTDESFKNQIIEENPDLNPDFIFLRPSHNFRSTEINAVLGLNQLKKLDGNNLKRKQNFDYFISKLNSTKYFVDFEMEGQCNYAFIVIMKSSSFTQRDLIEEKLKAHGIEFRRGLSGGGNQMRQPYFKEKYNFEFVNFQNIEHVHNFSWYIGNYPSLSIDKIDYLLNVLNDI